MQAANIHDGPNEDAVDQPDSEEPAMVQQPAIGQAMSKNQMKKLARRQRMLEGRKERRKVEREKRKQKRRELIKQLQENGRCQHVNIVKRTTLMSASTNKFRIVIDMNFDAFMTEHEISKAAKQVNRIYSLNRHSDRPCQLYLTGLTGRIKDRFAVTNLGYHSWDMNISEKDFLDVFDENKDDRDRIIYLTGDTDNTLPSAEEMLKDESKIFVIGGLVDHNRHKNLCFERAQKRNLVTAKLPIKEHVQLCQRHILSTVTVFEILMNVLASRMSWRDALLTSLPKRKIAPTDQDWTKQSDDKEAEKT